MVTRHLMGKECCKGWGMNATIISQEADFVHNVLVANNVINSNGSGIWLGFNPGSGGPPLYTK